LGSLDIEIGCGQRGQQLPLIGHTERQSGLGH
jgi:hypothetical protein